MEEFKKLLTECLFVLNQVSNQPYHYLNEDCRTYDLASKIQKALDQTTDGLEYECPECTFIFSGHIAYHRACNCDHCENNEL